MSNATTSCGERAMQHDAMVTTLRALKLFGMAQAVTELAQQGAPAYQGAQAILGSLLKAEMAEREVRSVAYQMKIARFPAYRDLAGFDFAQSSAGHADLTSSSPSYSARRLLPTPIAGAGNRANRARSCGRQTAGGRRRCQKSKMAA